MTDLLVGFAQDKSGSMGGLTQSTIDGFNEYLHALQSQEEEGIARLSLVQFDHELDVRFVARDVREVADLGTTENPYSVRGSTALLDAVATVIDGLDAWLAKHQDFDGKIIVVIQTDGAENASQNTQLDYLNQKIERRQGKGWELIFMGAGPDAWNQATMFTAIPQSNLYASMSTGSGLSTAYAAAAATSTSYRSGASGSMANTVYQGPAQ